MAPQIPTAVNLVACGPTAHYFRRAHQDRFTVGINNCHAGYNFTPDLIVAMDDLERDLEDHPKYVSQIVDAGCPVVTTRHFPAWPATEPYPLKDVVGWLDLDPAFASRLMNNSINYALAWLGMIGVKELHIFGVDFVEYDNPGIVRRQKNFLDKKKWPDWVIWHMEALIRAPTEPGLESCCWLLGYLVGQGVKIYLVQFEPDDQWKGTTLLNLDRPGYWYGYQNAPDI